MYYEHAQTGCVAEGTPWLHVQGLMPEFGTYPGGPGESPIVPYNDTKNAEREIIHGRFAMLAVTGAYTAEKYTGVPWYVVRSLYCCESWLVLLPILKACCFR